MSREALSEEQVRFYEDNGYLLLERRIPEDFLQRLRAEIDRLCAEARGLTAPNERIDLEDSHTPQNPRVRRIKQPDRISAPFAELMRSDWILAPVRDLIGPALRLHTSKLNMKSAGYGAVVEWHQDWAFYPHTNDDILAVGVIIDDMDEDNGPLMVFPGSHKGPVYDHHANGVFAGAMNLAANGLDGNDAARLTGPAGSISLHHVRAVHGSAPNRSSRPRRVVFYEITAADAFPLQGSMSPFESLEEYDSRLLCGEPTIEPRLVSLPVRIPQPQPATQGSIYEIQKAMAARNF